MTVEIPHPVRGKFVVGEIFFARRIKKYKNFVKLVIVETNKIYSKMEKVGR